MEQIFLKTFPLFYVENILMKAKVKSILLKIYIWSFYFRFFDVVFFCHFCQRSRATRRLGLKINYFLLLLFRQVQNRFYFSSLPNLLVTRVMPRCFYLAVALLLFFCLLFVKVSLFSYFRQKYFIL